jgi:L-alanine-DL-glutamate epimerase-like enolase superfamily enzyme
VTSAPLLRVREVELRERDVRLRLPFRFGAVTLREATEAFARVRITLEDGRAAWGQAAELLAPKWFDKDPSLSNGDNVEQLRASLRLARALYTEGRLAHTAFGLYAESHHFQIAEGRRQRLNSLVAGYGPALLDRAVLDALCSLHGMPFATAIRVNLPGIDPAHFLPEFAGFDTAGFLASLRPAERLHVRHTVGLVDPLTAADPRAPVGDGLPETLEDVVRVYGHRYFKLKVAGDPGADAARLGAIAAVLDRLEEPYHVTLDGNEQYASAEAVQALWAALEAAPGLRRLVDAILFLEQPITRAAALLADVSALGARRPVIIDESDGDLDAFVQARAAGYRGVSSKTCKGIYKAILNRARCALWNAQTGRADFFMSGEDLTQQAGIALQQDLALVSLLGLAHVEKNGHHYVNGMAGRPDAEQRRFAEAHPDLYAAGNPVRVRILEGQVAIRSLDCAGFATATEPDWASTRPMPD